MNVFCAFSVEIKATISETCFIIFPMHTSANNDSNGELIEKLARKHELRIKRDHNTSSSSLERDTRCQIQSLR